MLGYGQKVIVDVHISSEELLKLYEGMAKNARIMARDGRYILFPAHILRPYVTRSGVHGTFAIYFDETMKFQRIIRL